MSGRRQLDLSILDRFTETDLEQWAKRSADLESLFAEMYHGLEPQRRTHQSELVEALVSRPADPAEFSGWVRMVAYRWSLAPLSAAGSLRGYGGRFNVGADVDECTAARLSPALYLGDSQQTSFREFYQVESEEGIGGLSPMELSLMKSVSAVRLRGHIDRVFDATDLEALTPVAAVLARFRTPKAVWSIAKRLRLGPARALMIRTPTMLQAALQERNWRTYPVQFGLPSPSQVFADWVQAAGYEAIRYASSKNPGGMCLAVFPANLGSRRSFVELIDEAPDGVIHKRLDMDSAEDLSGWDALPARQRRAAKICS